MLPFRRPLLDGVSGGYFSPAGELFTLADGAVFVSP